MKTFRAIKKENEKLYSKKFHVKWDWWTDFEEMVERKGGCATSIKINEDKGEWLYSVIATEKQLRSIMIDSMIMCI